MSITGIDPLMMYVPKAEAPLGFSFRGVQSNVSKITKSPFSEIKSLKVQNAGGSMDPPSPPLTEPLPQVHM